MSNAEQQESAAENAPGDAGFVIRRAFWERDQAALCAVRQQVFVAEQGVPAALEWDGLDAEAVHLLATTRSGDRTIGTARLLSTGQIGRMAVAADWRRRGVGRALLLRLLQIAREDGLPEPWLNAQTHVLDFYSGLGFSGNGDVFDEAGIPHQQMLLADPDIGINTDIKRRRLGESGGLSRLDRPGPIRTAVGTLVGQIRRDLCILSSDLEPDVYDQMPVLDAVRRLAVERRGRLPVRILLADPGPAIRDGHRLLEVARRFTSAVEIRAIPEDLGEDQWVPFMLADDTGYCLRQPSNPEQALVDFNAGTEVRRLRRQFESIWEQSGVHQDLRRLYL